MIVKTIGRGQDNNIVVSDSKVSRVHLQMVQDDNGNISVVDLGSANGTYVNGKRITSETRLKAGDELRIGDTPLPWQNYFPAKVQQNAPTKQQIQVTPTPGPTKRNLKWIYIGGVLVLVLVVGGLLALRHHQKDELKQKEDESLVLKLENELKDAEKESLELEAEYTRAQEKARKAKSKRERDSLNSIVAEKAQQVTDAKKSVEKLTADKKLMETELAAAQSRLTQTSQELDNAKAAAEAQKTAATKAKEEAAKQENKARDALLQATLTNKFYELLGEADRAKLANACKNLGISVKITDMKDKLYNNLVSLFNEAKDNATRQKYIDALNGKPLDRSTSPAPTAADDSTGKGQTTTAQ